MNTIEIPYVPIQNLGKLGSAPASNLPQFKRYALNKFKISTVSSNGYDSTFYIFDTDTLTFTQYVNSSSYINMLELAKTDNQPESYPSPSLNSVLSNSAFVATDNKFNTDTTYSLPSTFEYIALDSSDRIFGYGNTPQIPNDLPNPQGVYYYRNFGGSSVVFTENGTCIMTGLSYQSGSNFYSFASINTFSQNMLKYDLTNKNISYLTETGFRLSTNGQIENANYLASYSNLGSYPFYSSSFNGPLSYPEILLTGSFSYPLVTSQFSGCRICVFSIRTTNASNEIILNTYALTQSSVQFLRLNGFKANTSLFELNNVLSADEYIISLSYLASNTGSTAQPLPVCAGTGGWLIDIEYLGSNSYIAAYTNTYEMDMSTGIPRQYPSTNFGPLFQLQSHFHYRTLNGEVINIIPSVATSMRVPGGYYMINQNYPLSLVPIFNFVRNGRMMLFAYDYTTNETWLCELAFVLGLPAFVRNYSAPITA